MNVNSVLNAENARTAASVENNAAAASSTGFSNYIDQASLKFGDYLEQIFQKASDTYQVSKDLLKAMAKAESNFQPKTTSHAGAMGIMQLMPATAASLGVTDAYDPEQNIMGGAKYISQLLERYNGNLSYAVAAYNAGSGNVSKYGGIPPFKETQNYVARVLQYMQEGVTIPDSSGSAGTSAGQASAQTQTGSTSSTNNTGSTNSAGSTNGTDSSSGNILQDIINKYFDYDDYLEFIQLFTKVIYEKVTGKSIDADTGQMSGTEQAGSTEQTADTQAQEPAKQLTMRIKDADGNVSTYRQEDSSPSDAYAAYQNMTAGRQNRLAVYLTPRSEEETQIQ